MANQSIKSRASRAKAARRMNSQGFFEATNNRGGGRMRFSSRIAMDMPLRIFAVQDQIRMQ
jgi:hypothetical protein